MNILSVVTDNNYDAVFNAFSDGYEIPDTETPNATSAFLRHYKPTNSDWTQEETTATEKGLIKHVNNAFPAMYLGYNTIDPSTLYFDGDEYVIDAKFLCPAGFSIGDQFCFGGYFSTKANEYFPNGSTWIIQCTVHDADNGIFNVQVFSVGVNTRTAISELFTVYGTTGANFGDFYIAMQMRRYLNSVYFWVGDDTLNAPTKIDSQTQPFIFVVRSLLNASNEKLLPIFGFDNDNNVAVVNRPRIYYLRSTIIKYFPEVIQPVYLALADGHYSVNKLDFVTMSNNYPLYHKYNIDLTAKNTNGVNILPNSIRISNVETVQGYVHVYLNSNHYIIKPQSELSLQLSGESSMMILGEDNCTVTLYDSGNLNLYGR